MAKNKKKLPQRSADMITVYNRRRVVFEGVERIVFCDSEKMIFEKRGLVTVEGKNMVLEELGNDNIAVCGKLSALKFGEA